MGIIILFTVFFGILLISNDNNKIISEDETYYDIGVEKDSDSPILDTHIIRSKKIDVNYLDLLELKVEGDKVIIYLFEDENYKCNIDKISYYEALPSTKSIRCRINEQGYALFSITGKEMLALIETPTGEKYRIRKDSDGQYILEQYIFEEV
jgi:hypothetical protein